MRESIQVSSFRAAFHLERRIHRIDRFRLPLPYGLPLRSLAYAAEALALSLLMSRLPFIGASWNALAAPIRLVIVPFAVACVLTRVRIDGRTAHAAGIAWLLFSLRPKRMVGFRAHDSSEVVVLGDIALARPERRG